MTDQSNLFNTSVDQPNPQGNPSPSTDALQDLLASIKNDQGQPKYKDVPTALDGLRHSQAFIEQLKAEKQAQEAELLRLKVELEKRAAVEDIVSKLSQNQSNTSTTPTETLTPAQIAELVQNQLLLKQSQDSKAENLRKVNDALVSRFGDKASEVLVAKAQELGMTVQELGELAQSKPQAVLAYFPTAQQTKPATAGINTSGFQASPASSEVPAPSKSLLSGATSKEQAAYMRQIRDEIYSKYGVTQP